jgi:hypothetical protein
LAFTVKHRTAVVLHRHGREPITGFIAGWDDFHWMIYSRVDGTNDLRKTMVHKGQVSEIEFTDQSYDALPEEFRALVDPMMADFRRAIDRDYFSKESL